MTKDEGAAVERNQQSGRQKPGHRYVPPRSGRPISPASIAGDTAAAAEPDGGEHHAYVRRVIPVPGSAPAEARPRPWRPAAGTAPGGASPFASIDNPISMMEHEHQWVGESMEKIRYLTHDYAVPADGCTTYRVAMQELEAFERDLHQHVHLENNILFPKARALARPAFA